jgi:predicted membrane channel-forming protein YqfA (hemolysin III family)
MEKTIRSYLNSLIVIFIFYFATRGIVKLFWKDKDKEVVNAKIYIIFVVLFLSSFIYIVGIYHIVGPANTNPYYKIYLFLAFIYLLIGIFYDIYSNSILKK